MTQEKELKELTDPEHQELLSLYQVTVSDLVFFKSQQWAITNYTLVAFAAIVGIQFVEGVNIESCGRFFLCLAATIVYFFSIYLLYSLKSSIEERRDRLKRVFEKFSEIFKDARGNKKQVSATDIFIFLFIILTISIVLVWWLVFAIKLST